MWTTGPGSERDDGEELGDDDAPYGLGPGFLAVSPLWLSHKPVVYAAVSFHHCRPAVTFPAKGVTPLGRYQTIQTDKKHKRTCNWGSQTKSTIERGQGMQVLYSYITFKIFSTCNGYNEPEPQDIAQSQKQWKYKIRKHISSNYISIWIKIVSLLIRRLKESTDDAMGRINPHRDHHGLRGEQATTSVTEFPHSPYLTQLLFFIFIIFLF